MLRNTSSLPSSRPCLRSLWRHSSWRATLHLLDLGCSPPVNSGSHQITRPAPPLVKALKAREAYLRPFAQGTRPYKLIEELLALEQASPEPLPKLPEGRTANAAATWARQALAAANVPKGLPRFHQTLARLHYDKHAKNLHDALLMAVGLIRYGSSRHAAPRCTSHSPGISSPG